MSPFVLHATHLVGGDEVRIHRLREARLWNDPPEYYEQVPLARPLKLCTSVTQRVKPLTCTSQVLLDVQVLKEAVDAAVLPPGQVPGGWGARVCNTAERL